MILALMSPSGRHVGSTNKCYPNQSVLLVQGARRPALAVHASRRITHRACRRSVLSVQAHGNHGHSHSHRCTDHDHSHCSHSESSMSSVDFCCDGDDHFVPGNPIHTALAAIYDATRLSRLAAWLEGSTISSISKIVLFLIAAISAWYSGHAATEIQAATLHNLSNIATWGVYFFAGIPAAVDLLYDISSGKIDTHVLMNLAVIGTLVTGYPLEGALLLVLFQTSHALEHALADKARGNLQALYDAVPDTATLVEVDTTDGSPIMGSLKKVSARTVNVGQCVFVRPGEQIPLDGTILHGRALVSAEHLTGESLPTLRRPGDAIPAGALCHDGALTVRVTQVAEESTPARIVRLTEDAQKQRPKLRTFLDTIGEVYSKLVIVASLAAFLIMVASGVPALGSSHGHRSALYRAMGLLTVASPCALVMVPLAYVSAIAAIASRGVVLKGGRVLDALAKCRVVAVDKTGTLTTGRLSLTGLKCITRGSSSDIIDSERHLALEAASALSLRSNHPVSDAIVLHAASQGINGDSIHVSNFRLVAGGGTEGIISGTVGVLHSIDSSTDGSSSSENGSSSKRYKTLFGSLEFVSDSLSSDEKSAIENVLNEQRLTNVVSILVLQRVDDAGNATGVNHGVWVLSFEDSVRQQSAAAVASLKTGSWAKIRGKANHTCDVIMLTGDNAASADRIAAKLGIDTVRAGLSPEQKLEIVKSYRSDAASSDSNNSTSQKDSVSKEHHRYGVVMVGDGLNDAAALAAADVGIAVAEDATAAASLAADAIVVSSSSGFAALPLLLRVARATRHVVAQNLALAAGSILCLALPTVLGFVPLWVAVMLHEGSTLLVALNSLRLLRFSKPVGSKNNRKALTRGGVTDVEEENDVEDGILENDVAVVSA